MLMLILISGEIGDAFYVIEEGRFDIEVTEKTGAKKLVGYATAKDAVGEYALMYNTPRTATLKVSPSIDETIAALCSGN